MVTAADGATDLNVFFAAQAFGAEALRAATSKGGGQKTQTKDTSVPHSAKRPGASSGWPPRSPHHPQRTKGLASGFLAPESRRGRGAVSEEGDGGRAAWGAWRFAATSPPAPLDPRAPSPEGERAGHRSGGGADDHARQS